MAGPSGTSTPARIVFSELRRSLGGTFGMCGEVDVDLEGADASNSLPSALSCIGNIKVIHMRRGLQRQRMCPPDARVTTRIARPQ